MMKLFWYNIKEMTTEEYDAAMAMMSAERRRRISDFPAEDDRKRSAAGELLLRRALGEQLGVIFCRIGKNCELVKKLHGDQYAACLRRLGWG